MTHQAPSHPTSRRGRHILAGLAAAVALVALVAGVPWALTRYIGWPLPHHFPTWHQTRTTLSTQGIPDRVLLDTLAVIVWLAWTTLITALGAELTTTLRRSPTHIPRLARPAHRLTAPLIAAITVGVLALGRTTPTLTVPLSTALGHTGTPTAQVALVFPLASTDSRAAAEQILAADIVPSQRDAATRTYVVQRRDTLWGIAQRELADPYRWRELFELNHNRPQPAHGTLTDPNNLQPGWTLLLPIATAHEPATSTPPSVMPPAIVPDSSAPVPPPEVAAPPLPVIPATPLRREPDSRTAAPDQVAGRTTAGAISLSTGSLVAGSFALGLATALTAQRLRRRHTYQPSPPAAGLPAAAPPLPPTLRGVLNALAPDDLAPLHASDAPSALSLAGVATAADTGDAIELGINDNGPVTATIRDLSPLTLTGTEPGAALRAWLTHLITNHPAGDLHVRTDIGGSWILGLGDTLHLPVAITTTSTDLLDVLHADVIHRTRRLTDADIPDATTYRATHPEDPFPVLLAVTAALSPADRERWTRLTTDAGRLGILAIHFGRPQGSDTERSITTDDTHTVTAAHPAALADRINGTRCYHLTAEEARELLTAQNADDQAEPTDVVDLRDDPAPMITVPASEPWIPPASATPAEQKPIRVRLLGVPTIIVNGTTITTGLRRSAVELLAWYALHPNGAPAAAAIDAIWPDVPADRGPQRFWTALGNLRTRTRTLNDGQALDLLAKHGELYLPDAEVLSVDLWDFQESLRASTSARRSGDLGAERQALEKAVEAHGGALVDCGDYLWADPYRSDIHRRALDCRLRLAALQRGSGDLAGAIEQLAEAIEHDRYSEEPYRRLMEVYAEADDRAGLARTWRVLQGRLAELDLEIGGLTLRHYADLTSSESPTERGKI